MNKLHNEPIVGEEYECTIQDIFPFGVFVAFGDKWTGYIRRRELSWDQDADPDQFAKRGDSIPAVVLALPTETTQNIELSHRRAISDPWEEFLEKHEIGDIVPCEVISTVRSGLWARIQPGVEGFIPIREVPLKHNEEIGDVFWIRDRIEARIIGIHRTHDIERRHLVLSIRQRTRLAKHNDFVNAIQRHIDAKDSLYHQSDSIQNEFLLTLQSEEKQSIDSEMRLNLGRVLIVDDELVDPLLEWFTNRHFDADGAATISEARRLLSEHAYSIVIIDMKLRDGDGLSLIQEFHDMLSGAHVFVMSIPDWLRERAAEIEMIGVTVVIDKPIDLKHLESLISRVANGQFTQDRPPIGTEELHSSNYMETGRLLEISLEDYLDFLSARIGASGAALFARVTESDLNVDNQPNDLVEVVSKSTRLSTKSDSTDHLHESPVMDVMRRQQVVQCIDATAKSIRRQHRRLLEFIDYKSCLGVPIEVQGSTSYALFVFSERTDAFSRDAIERFQMMSPLCAAKLEHELTNQVITEQGRLLMSGKLNVAFRHDALNKISKIQIDVDNAKLHMSAEINKLSDEYQKEGFLAVLKRLHTIFEGMDDLGETFRLFKRLDTPTGESYSNLADVLRDTRQFVDLHLSNMGYDPNMVAVKFETTGNLSRVAGSETRLQHVFLNLILNAIQQMHMQNKQYGEVRVSAENEESANPKFAIVRVSDTGPGIHRVYWHKVFSLGFTTRVGGSGLGLYIVKVLVNALGGEVYVEDSVITVGTTFVVKLPLIA